MPPAVQREIFLHVHQEPGIGHVPAGINQGTVPAVNDQKLVALHSTAGRIIHQIVESARRSRNGVVRCWPCVMPLPSCCACCAPVAGPSSTAQCLATLPEAQQVAVDNVETLSDAGQIALFNHFNRLKMAGGQLLTAAAQPPAHLALREDLRTRLGYGLLD